MKIQALALATAMVLAGCGAAPLARGAVRPAVQTAQGATTFTKLTNVQVHKGGPDDWYAKAKNHISARAGTGGTIWIIEYETRFEVLHDTREVTNATKLAQVITALENLAAQSDDKAYAAELKRFALGIRTLIKR